MNREDINTLDNNGDVGSTKDYPSDNEENGIECMEMKTPELGKFKTCYDIQEDTVDYIVDNSDEL